MAQVLRRLTPPSHPDLLVGTDTGDDAAVWRLDASRALVVTADFITPVVDDAATWGRIAASNAASDVYAMGGRPLLALNLVMWNSDELDNDVLVQVLEGANRAAAEGGWVVVGGHTVDDPEPKFGQAVVGEVHPARLLTNAGLRPGDDLVLTKAVGTGIVATAVKRALAPEAVVEAAVASMVRLNAVAAEVALRSGATGATDVTGFGLLGHLAKMAEASGVDVEIDASSVPVLAGAAQLAASGAVPGGTTRNLAWVRDRLTGSGSGSGRGSGSGSGSGRTGPGDLDELTLVLLADAQTSGGLLFGAEPGQAREAVASLRDSGHDAAVVGRVTAAGSGLIAVRAG